MATQTGTTKKPEIPAEFLTKDIDIDEKEPFRTEDLQISDEFVPTTSDGGVAYIMHYLTKTSPTTSRIHRSFTGIAPFIQQLEAMQERYMGHVIPHNRSLTKIINHYLALTPAVGGERGEQLTKIASAPRYQMGMGMEGMIMKNSEMQEKPSRWKFWKNKGGHQH